MAHAKGLLARRWVGLVGCGPYQGVAGTKVGGAGWVWPMPGGCWHEGRWGWLGVAHAKGLLARRWVGLWPMLEGCWLRGGWGWLYLLDTQMARVIKTFYPLSQFCANAYGN